VKNRTGAKSTNKGNAKVDSENASDRWRMFFLRWQHRIEDLVIILMGVLTIVSILGLLDLTEGELINPWVQFIKKWLGWGVWIVPVATGYIVIWLYRWRKGIEGRFLSLRLIAFEIFVISVIALLAILDGLSIPRAEAGKGGGLIGWGIATFLGNIMGDIGSLVIFLLLSIMSGLYVFQEILKKISLRWMDVLQRNAPEDHVEARESNLSSQMTHEETKKEPARRLPRIPRRYKKNFQLPALEEEKASQTFERSESLPPYEILEEGSYSRISIKEINTTASLIEKTLSDFGLPVRVVDFRTGPSVTQFAVEPGYVEATSSDGSIRRQKVRVSQISSLANDLALSLSASRVRVEAPVPGQAYVGIEVPNRKSSIVRLRPILESQDFQSIRSPLAIALGRDVAGKPVVADLKTMPHLLIAGTTGSGKSVCITSLACSLVFNNHPKDLQIVMVDPKMVELVRFNGLPHLIGKAETELERIIGVLRWCTLEMDRRYKLLEEAKARDIDNFNQKARRRKKFDSLARIVIMIDELADLMMMVPDQTEHTLVRLAQMARATGIHLVVATQRPSTDVVTGLIKANFPARISFAVASSVDSRVILDMPGAESLLGRGDMLFLSAEASTPIRLQGAFVNDLEIERLIKYWQTVTDREGWETEEPAPWNDLLARQEALEDHDEIIERAVELVRSTGSASASMLQRRLRIGYPRAARLMDELEDLGVIGRPQSGGRTREVLIGKDEDPFDQLVANGEDEEDSSS
jgi:S-DNA-T family DNA segregation ATPase FtsK/SpoIIIE